ncbi:3-isopropylmalate dehydratase [candidate division WOR-3 bacterium 4484_100]|uniref:3-isopropylmalate dehydratase small subunit n=1 Tax=candidate division WOR-3 bacterium 4484_100 TaxID=1936077 RepID=A0A1V4QGM3_UNCW3|nr:MAG: 3-isopropylmalate dehydratase [candidate division WOR-3 bacterium 4484_100]
MIKGRIWKFGDDIDTDQIYPGKYLPLTDKSEMAKHAMEGTNRAEEFRKDLRSGDIIVAGKNFGCGSSREHAPVSIKEAGIACVVAQSFARIFRRNAVNIGLPIIQMREIGEIQDGDILQINLETGVIENLTSKKVYSGTPCSKLELEIMKAGGLLRYLKEAR